jgi:biotin carboxyl carrier protein
MALHRQREALLRDRVLESRATIGAEREQRDLERRLRNVEPSQARHAHMPAVAPQRELTLRATVAAERGPTRRQARVPAGSDLVTIAKSAAKSAKSAAARLPAAVARGVVGSLAPSPAAESDHDVALHRLWRRGLAFIAVFGGALGLWAVATTMSSAVIAPGQFVVDGSVKKVQHPTGGIVGELLVREGDQVAQGDLLIRLDETVTRANLQVIVRQLQELGATDLL